MFPNFRKIISTLVRTLQKSNKKPFIIRIKTINNETIGTNNSPQLRILQNRKTFLTSFNLLQRQLFICLLKSIVYLFIEKQLLGLTYCIPLQNKIVTNVIKHYKTKCY